MHLIQNGPKGSNLVFNGLPDLAQSSVTVHLDERLTYSRPGYKSIKGMGQTLTLIPFRFSFSLLSLLQEGSEGGLWHRRLEGGPADRGQGGGGGGGPQPAPLRSAAAGAAWPLHQRPCGWVAVAPAHRW